MRVMPPPVPLMVMVEVPIVAWAPTVTVMVDVPEPGAGMGFTLKVFPVPVAFKVTAASKPPLTFEVITEVPELPRAMVSVVGDAVSVKLPFAAAVTVRETVVVCVTPPPTP